MKSLEAFQALGLSEETLKALSKKGFEEPTPVQKETIPLLMAGEVDVIAQAATHKTFHEGRQFTIRIAYHGDFVTAHR